jgi:hypothetical protein
MRTEQKSRGARKRFSTAFSSFTGKLSGGRTPPLDSTTSCFSWRLSAASLHVPQKFHGYIANIETFVNQIFFQKSRSILNGNFWRIGRCYLELQEALKADSGSVQPNTGQAASGPFGDGPRRRALAGFPYSSQKVRYLKNFLDNPRLS